MSDATIEQRRVTNKQVSQGKKRNKHMSQRKTFVHKGTVHNQAQGRLATESSNSTNKPLA